MTAAAPEEFYAGAERRIFRWLVVLAVGGAVTAFALQQWPFAWGFVIGAAVGMVNFRWLRTSVQALTERMAQRGEAGQPAERSSGVVMRFLLRYVLIGVVAYVIFTSSALSVYGFLVGLVLPIGAVMCEAAYEAYVALRRGI